MVTTLNDTVINSANTTVDTPFTLTTVNFGVTTNPNPLQANTNGTITVVASKFGTDSVTCSQIKLVISVGSSAASLTNDAATINPIPPKSWALDAASEGGTFIFKPVAGGYVDLGDKGLAFTLDKIAISDIGVTEFFVEGSFQIGGNPKPEMITVPLPKFPQGFTLSALTADQSSINPGEPVTLSWSGSQGDYTLSYGGQNIPDLSNQGNYPVNDLNQTTTFTLDVKAAGGTVEVQRQLTITVLRPFIEEFGIVNNPGTVIPRSTIKLYWKTEKVDHCALSLNGTPIYDKLQLPANVDASTGYSITVPKSPQECEYELTAFPGKDNNGGVVQNTIINVSGFNVLPNPFSNLSPDPFQLLISPDGTRLYVAGGLDIAYSLDAQGFLTIVSTSDGKIMHSEKNLACANYPAMTLSKDGSQLLFPQKNGPNAYSPIPMQVMNTSSYSFESMMKNQLFLAGGAFTNQGSYFVAPLYHNDTSSLSIYVFNASSLFSGQVKYLDTAIRIGALYQTRTACFTWQPQSDRVLFLLNGELYSYSLGSNTVSDLGLSNNLYILFNQIGTRYYLAKLSAAEIDVVDAATDQVISTIPLPASAKTMVLSSDGRFLYATLFNQTLAQIDTTGVEPVYTAPVGTCPTGLAITSDGTRLYVADAVGAPYTQPSKIWTVEI